jgi:hypothetical protein
MSNIEDIKNDLFISIFHGNSQCRDRILEIIQTQNKEDDFVGNVFNLVKFVSERSISIIILLQNDLLWDAQILMRSVQEATMKISFLCNCSKEEQQERTREFIYDLEEINLLKQSEIAKKMVLAFEGHESLILPFSPLILDVTKEEELKAKWPSKKRKTLEQKWSYSEMMREQAERSLSIKDRFLSLAHPYRISSHLLHADETGIGIIAERSLRNDEDKEKVETSHFAGLLTSVFNYYIVCGYAICIAFDKDPKIFHDIAVSLAPTYDKVKELQLRVYYSDPSYDKFRT